MAKKLFETIATASPLQELPLWIADFKGMRDKEENFVYVDKTAYLHELTRKKGCYFFARPRRFGKSLMLSTIEAIYEGKRELFKGLAIDVLQKKWDSRAVIHLDMSTVKEETLEAFEQMLRSMFRALYKKHKVPFVLDLPATMFRDVITTLQETTGKQVVILIDEYDAPILNVLSNAENAKLVRASMQKIYNVL
ncbi:MAG: AAA family ATPase, partial [Nanoarchaeota archaeon]